MLSQWAGSACICVSMFNRKRQTAPHMSIGCQCGMNQTVPQAILLNVACTDMHVRLLLCNAATRNQHTDFHLDCTDVGETVPLLEIWAPVKKVKARSEKSDKVITKKLMYRGGGAVYVRGALDNSVIELVEKTYYFQAWRQKLLWGYDVDEVRCVLFLCHAYTPLCISGLGLKLKCLLAKRQLVAKDGVSCRKCHKACALDGYCTDVHVH